MVIAPTDIICKSCYDMHRTILRTTTEPPVTTLKVQTSQWRDELKDEKKQLTRAILATVIYVARRLQEDRALLLPHVATIFLEVYPHSAHSEVYLELGEDHIKFTLKWLMKQLILHLHPYMHYTCVAKKLGTLLYSRTSNVLPLMLPSPRLLTTPFNLSA